MGTRSLLDKCVDLARPGSDHCGHRAARILRKIEPVECGNPDGKREGIWIEILPVGGPSWPLSVSPADLGTGERRRPTHCTFSEPSRIMGVTMGFFLLVVDAIATVFHASRERKAGEELTPGHRIMVALAIVFGLLAIAVLSLWLG